MVAVTQHLEEKQKRVPDVEGDLSKAHTGLMRQLWTRATLVESLKVCTYKLIEQNGRVAIEVVPPVSKEVTPWHHMGSQGRVFKLFSTNSKMKCVAGGTPVLTDRGVLPIELVRVGDKVLTREGYRLVRAAQQTGVRETLRIVTVTGQEVRVTPDHLILAKAAWPLGECPSPSLRGELEWTRADCLNTEMFVCPAPEGFDAGLPRQASDKELGVLLGYVCGDGSFAENGRVVVDVGEQKRDNLQILADIASRRFGASPHWGEYSGHRSTKGLVEGSGRDPEEYESCFRLYWETPALTAFFAEHGFRHKVYSPMREVPQSILRGSRDFMLGFLGGYLSSDGSVHTTSEGRVMAEISTTSRLLALGVQQLFAVLGARVSVTRTEHWQGEKQFRDLYRITITSAAALDVLREAEPINGHKRERLGEPQKLRPKTRLVRIETIERDRLCLPVYDLTVDGPSEFVAGGVIVHNCPTFDLPSGVTKVGGSCPAALFGQTTALGQKLVEMTGDIRTAERSFSDLLDERQAEWEAMRAYQAAHGLPAAPPFKRSLKIQDAVCNYCYASSGKYGETSVQLGELVRFGWVSSLLESDPKLLVETLFRTINETKLEGESQERFPFRFIRVHSSGDFFNPAYAQAWLDVAALLWRVEQEAKAKGDTSHLPVRLWAPTRTNFVPGMLRFWRSAKVPGNFVIRFSGYAIGDPAPYIHRPSPTQCKGSSVLSEAETKVLRKSPGEKFDWQCGVYDLGKGDKTCLAARAPDGKVGCRACWLHPEFAVNYAQH